MFDYVNYKVKCPTCGKEISDFQSKDGGCMMDTLEPKDVCNFYALCHDCHTWIEYNRKQETEVEKDFEMTYYQADYAKKTKKHM